MNALKQSHFQLSQKFEITQFEIKELSFEKDRLQRLNTELTNQTEALTKKLNQKVNYDLSNLNKIKQLQDENRQLREVNPKY